MFKEVKKLDFLGEQMVYNLKTDHPLPSVLNSKSLLVTSCGSLLGILYTINPKRQLQSFKPRETEMFPLRNGDN